MQTIQPNSNLTWLEQAKYWSPRISMGVLIGSSSLAGAYLNANKTAHSAGFAILAIASGFYHSYVSSKLKATWTKPSDQPDEPDEPDQPDQPKESISPIDPENGPRLCEKHLTQLHQALKDHYSKAFNSEDYTYFSIVNVMGLKWIANHGANICSSSSFLENQLISRMKYFYIAIGSLTLSIFQHAISILDYLPSLLFSDLAETRNIRLKQSHLNLQASFIAFKGVTSPKKAIEKTIDLLWNLHLKSPHGIFYSEDTHNLAHYSPAILAAWSTSLSLPLGRLNTMISHFQPLISILEKFMEKEKLAIKT